MAFWMVGIEVSSTDYINGASNIVPCWFYSNIWYADLAFNLLNTGPLDNERN